MAFFPLLKVFIWKNFLNIKYHLIPFLLLLLLCVGLMVLYCTQFFSSDKGSNVIFDAKPEETLITYYPIDEQDWLYYAPNDPFVNDLMEEVRVNLQLKNDNFKPVSNIADMQKSLEDQCKGRCFSVAFHNFENKDNLNYTVTNNRLDSTIHLQYINDERNVEQSDDDTYIRNGIFTLMHVINKVLIKSKAEDTIYNLNVAAIPSIAKFNVQYNLITNFGSTFYILFSIFLLITFLVPIVEEKQDGIKEYLVIATPSSYLNEMSFFLIQIPIYLFYIGTILLVAFMYPAMSFISATFVVLLFFLFMLASMAYAYLISVCFNNAFYAKIGGFILLLTPYIFNFIENDWSHMLSYLFCSCAFMDGMKVFQSFTYKARNFTYHDLLTITKKDSTTIFSVYMLLIAQFIGYLVLYKYLSCLFPGPGGIKKQKLFFLKPSYYKREHENKLVHVDRNTPETIIIKDLVKRFENKDREIVIADNLNIVMKNKQIAVLLGCNGVGKTTLINMILGTERKDSGSIEVCTDRYVTFYRHSIGFCPQHSVFMPYMTCFEHIKFFAMLRGKTENEANTVAAAMLQKLKLEYKAKEYAGNLSGGMKRRLSVGMAISGDTKIIILDEPSAGLDIESRRELWNVLLELRKNRAILITTHHLDEAEVLGDIICILADGRITLKGSPLELKSKYGNGYILKLQTKPNEFKEKETLDLIKKRIHNIELMNAVPPSLHISLPYKYKKNYSSMLLDLEKNLEMLGIESFTITDTSLEEVFLNSLEDKDEVDTGLADIVKSPYTRLNMVSTPKFWILFYAIFYKKILYLLKYYKFFLIMFFLPFIAVGVCIIAMDFNKNNFKELDIPVSLKQFKGLEILLHSESQSETLCSNVIDILKQDIQDNNVNIRELVENSQKTLPADLIQLQEKNYAHFLQNVLGLINIHCIDEKRINGIIYFSSNIMHSSVSLLNLLDSAMLKGVIQTNGLFDSNDGGEDDNEDQPKNETTKMEQGIFANIKPVEKQLSDESAYKLEYYAVAVPIGLFLWMLSFLSMPFSENLNNFKSVRTMPPSVYWTSTFILDAIIHGILCITLAIFQLFIMRFHAYSPYETFTIMASCFFYGLSYLPILYSFAHLFKSLSTISAYLILMFLIACIVPLITSANFIVMDEHRAIISLFAFMPDFNLCNQLRIINEINVFKQHFTTAQSEYKPPFTCGVFFLYAFVTMFLSMLFYIFVLENPYTQQSIHRFICCFKCRETRRSKPTRMVDEEPFVQHERMIVDEIVRKREQNDYPLVVHRLYKAYGSSIAVRSLNMAVKRKECFGLLGVNGAGKTTSFEIIATNGTYSNGNIFVHGIDLYKNRNLYKNKIGYCPQHEPLNDFMTAYQTLKYTALTRGLRESIIPREASYWIKNLDLTKYRNVNVSKYSGGTKRKLSVAVALIGNPPVVILDEPSTGVDPKSKQFLWKCISEYIKNDKTVLLSSHSMDECERLCNRVGIMSDGRLRCLGTVADLKSNYGSGITLRIKMLGVDSATNIANVNKQVQTHFPFSQLREMHSSYLTFFVPNIDDYSWSTIFKMSETLKKSARYLVDDYSISEANFEDIVLRIMANQDYHHNRKEQKDLDLIFEDESSDSLDEDDDDEDDGQMFDTEVENVKGLSYPNM